METLVGTVGDSCDNALAETVNGLYKAEAEQAYTHDHALTPVMVSPRNETQGASGRRKGTAPHPGQFTEVSITSVPGAGGDRAVPGPNSPDS